jgi:hypothetical protein
MAVTTNFSFLKLIGADSAGYTTINNLIDSIDAILNARIPASSDATSVIGRASSTVGATAPIIAAADNTVLKRSGGALSFGTISQSSINDFVFTNEAARDAAITSPTEGMRAYLTAPTIPAATGSVTSIPTGIQTIYNGSVWVCVTEVASTSVTNTNFSLTSSFAAGWTGGSGDTSHNNVTLVTGTTALVNLGLIADNASNSTPILLGVSVTGASSISASYTYSVAGNVFSIGNIGGCNGAVIVTGLTAGTNTFTLLATNGAPTQTMRANRRFISVRGIA